MRSGSIGLWFLWRSDQVLIKEVVEVDLWQCLWVKAFINALGFQLILKYPYFHQKQGYHPFFHQDLKGFSKSHSLLFSLEQISQTRHIFQWFCHFYASFLQNFGKNLLLKVLNDLIAVFKDVTDKEKHFESNLLRTDIYHIWNNS